MPLPKMNLETFGVRFLDLPLEAREKVYGHMADVESRADVTMAPSRRGNRAMRLQCMFPPTLRTFSSLLGTPQLEDEVTTFLSKLLVFHGNHSNGFLDMPQVLGPEICSLIQKLELRTEFGFNAYPISNWPKYLVCFVEELPNLKWLKLYSKWSNHSQPYLPHETKDPAGTIIRLVQVKRALFRFTSWLNLRHPNFGKQGRLIRCAESPYSYFVEDVEKHIYFCILEQYKARRPWEKKILPLPLADDEWEEPQDKDPEIVYDEILDTKLLRRVKWETWQNNGFDENKFIIHPVEGQSKSGIESSEVGDGDNKYFEKLDQRGYQLFNEVVKPNKWHRSGPIRVNDLIDHCIALKAKAIERAEQEERSQAARADNGRQARGAYRGRGRGFGRARGRGTALAYRTTAPSSDTFSSRNGETSQASAARSGATTRIRTSNHNNTNINIDVTAPATDDRGLGHHLGRGTGRGRGQAAVSRGRGRNMLSDNSTTTDSISTNPVGRNPNITFDGLDADQFPPLGQPRGRGQGTILPFHGRGTGRGSGAPPA